MDRRLELLQQEVGSAISGLTSDQLTWHPPGKWCVAEVLEHLYLTYSGTLKGFQRVTEAKHSLCAMPPGKHLGRRFVVLFNYLPSGREAPPVARPRGLPIGTVLTGIGPKISEMDEMISLCEQQLGRGKLLDHPILGSLTARQWRKFHLLHGRHHIKQIQRLRQGSRGSDAARLRPQDAARKQNPW
jgi:hypothetical protein